MSKVDVLIVGAGPTGLVLACELARRGVSYRLIERGDGPAFGSRGKGVQPRSLEVLDDLGVAKALIDLGRFDMPVVVHDKDGTTTLAPFVAQREDTRYRSVLLTPQWQVEAVLRAKLAEIGGSIDWASELVGLEQTDDLAIATVRSGGKEERIDAAWLVGCDGGQSAVRKYLGAPFVGETFEQIRMWVGDVILEGLDRDHWHMWRDGRSFLALCPLPGTKQFQFQAPIDSNEHREPSLTTLAGLVRQRTSRDDIRLLDAGWLSTWRANVRMVERYRHGRLLLAGDAAHVHSPAGAQGMNTGIQDAYNLGWKLAAALTGADIGLIDTYQQERLPVARSVLDLSSELTRTAFSPDQRRSDRTMQLDLAYRASSLSAEVGDASPIVRAGDRAPDAAGLRGFDGIERRLFDLLRGPHMSVLVFGDDLPTAIEAAVEPFGEKVRLMRIAPADVGATGCWTDAHGAVERLYAPAAGALMVVRPDGHIGLTCSTAHHAELRAYLRGIIASRAGCLSAAGAPIERDHADAAPLLLADRP